MSAARLLLLLLLVVVAVVIVLVVLRRGAARRDAQRVEAAGLRADADTMAATVAGQTVFADQAAERAELARVEAEDKAREAARLEEEAAEHRAAVEASQRDYETAMRRADDIDPDVKESAFAPVPDAGDEAAGDAAGAAGSGADMGDAAAGSDADAGDAGETTMTRAARREAREAEPEGDAVSGNSAPSAASSAATAGAAGGAAAGAAAWATRSDDESDDQSERIASAADFRDDVPADAHEDVYAAPHRGSEAEDVYVAPAAGSEADMSDDTRTGTSDDARHEDGLDAGGAAVAASAESGGGYAATRALHEQQGPGAAESPEADHDVAHDAQSPRGEWGGPHDDGAHDHTASAADDHTGAGRGEDERAADDTAAAAHTTVGTEGAADGADAPEVERTVEGRETGEAGQVTVIGDVESYAASEPVLAEDQAPPVNPQDADADGQPAHEPASEQQDERRDEVASVEERDDHLPTDDRLDTDERTQERDDDHPPAEAGAAVAETDDTDRSAADVAEQPTQERYDPTPTRDWAADEGELLDETHDRGERLESERSELAQRSDDAAGVAAAEVDDHGDEGSETGDTPAEPSRTRRISGFDELRDGGFGVGSAAPLDDGAQPLDHPVQGYRDTMTYRVPGDTDYDSAEPHVWFYDEDAARRNGFRRSEG